MKLQATFLRMNLFLLAILITSTVIAHGQGKTYSVYLPFLATPRLFEIIPSLETYTNVTDISTTGLVGDKRIFLLDKNGIVRVVNAEGVSSVFMDISDRIVQDGYEQGLLGIAFHPNYATNGYFYLSYTANNPGNTGKGYRIYLSRFEVSADDSNLGNRDSERYILNFHDDHPLHNGGGLMFSPIDGHLMMGIGDDNNPGYAQEENSIKGKLIRIDVDHISDSPVRTFTEGNSFAPAEIWAKGLRNPWRFDFDPTAGHLYIGDVGNAAREEINLILYSKGFDMGWPCYEGNQKSSIFVFYPCTGKNFVFPIFDYAHTTEWGCSVIGGKVYRPNNNPEEKTQYIFADLCRNEIRRLVQNNDVWEYSVIGKLPANYEPVAFHRDVTGTIYVAALNGHYFQLYIPSYKAP